jgi:hypothetical protein
MSWASFSFEPCIADLVPSRDLFVDRETAPELLACHA